MERNDRGSPPRVSFDPVRWTLRSRTGAVAVENRDVPRVESFSFYLVRSGKTLTGWLVFLKLRGGSPPLVENERAEILIAVCAQASI